MTTLKEKLFNLVVPPYAAVWSKPGYDASKIPDLTDQTALVTGATVGLGFESALELAKKGAHVFITARSQEKGDAALKAIKAQSGSEKVALLIADFSSLKHVKAAADTFLASGLKLNILINNAGVLSSAFSLTPDGIETDFAVNHVAPFLLTTTLLPALAPRARIVNVTSYAQYACTNPLYDARVNDPALAGAWMARYANSKLANVLFTRALQSKLGDGYFVNCCHPGTVRTELNRQVEMLPFVGSMISMTMGLIAQPVEVGALTQLFLATSPEVEEEGFKGEYFVAVAKRPNEKLNKLAFDEALREKLWAFTEELIREKLGGT